MNTKITVVGIGYVGLSIATLLSQKNFVVAVDISEEKVAAVNRRISPVDDKYIKKYFNEKSLNLSATMDFTYACEDSDFIIIAVPTNYSPEKNYFDTSTVQSVLESIFYSKFDSTVVIKSTVPVGFTKSMRRKFSTDKIIFSPEFLRESNVLYDNLYPSRIVVGTDINDPSQRKNAKIFAKILAESAIKENIPTLITGMSEAEAIKLFANTYLAMRIAYFNELDTYAEMKGLNTRDIIEGVCYDSRIGDYYNNPSFGYGGYCLPKDTKQLLANYHNVPENLIEAIVKSNTTRKNFIAEQVLSFISAQTMLDKNIVVGIYRLTMKIDSNNFRQSPVQEVIKKLTQNKITVIIYEPLLENGTTFENCQIVNNLYQFKKVSTCIVANRYDKILDDVKEKVYTRDLFRRD